MRRLRPLLLALALVGCGGQPIQAGAAYAAVMSAARHVCAVIDALPAPAPTSGGEQPATP